MGMCDWLRKNRGPLEMRVQIIEPKSEPEKPKRGLRETRPEEGDFDAPYKFNVKVLRGSDKPVLLEGAQSVTIDSGALYVEWWRERRVYFWRSFLIMNDPTTGYWDSITTRIDCRVRVFAPGEWTGYESTIRDAIDYAVDEVAAESARGDAA